MKATTERKSIAADWRWAAVVARERAADGRFVYAVRTTGVYCRPSCGARLPRPENVVFHATPQAAEAAGFRACRRCRPERPAALPAGAADVAELCRAMDGDTDEMRSLRALADRAGLSPFHLHRRFKALTGVTPKMYASLRRVERLRSTLRSSGSVTEAAFEAGFGSLATAYQQAERWLGMKPTTFRAGGAGASIRFVTEPSSLGVVLVGATERGVCSILLGDDADALSAELARRFPRASRQPGGADMRDLVAAVLHLVENPGGGAAALPLDIRGTAFQLRVWDALTKIPAGQTMSYAALAAAIGAPTAVRAVAGACASNHLAVVIPCHRVVRGDGGLAGYRWGVARKRALLDRERPASLPKDQRPSR